jgi:DNA-binding response OmpR family regulator
VGAATPVLLLTVHSQTIEKVVGLKLGVDAYVTKPFETFKELARIEPLSRAYHSGLRC